ncbi:heme o synthase [Longimicrobium terrae]|uniref:Protoheme IX farnesyltransferase n=1 Tax=Longimicrobium terrae TaxID=1639882 RepID=A0A841GKH9_9BACT|nr:heme o synthase [Longimicrobium terrae]MBB4634836.1 protoheme IX farnesyltransferase [Longimicrobium terrae]MBB6069231.1 protoheme IX farnesyltransferase [Longimicrobium terrae]
MSDAIATFPPDAPLARAAGTQGGTDGEMTTATQRAGIAAARTGSGGVAQRLRDYVTLTKPRIISLLLVTTVAPMLIALGRMPSWSSVMWTMLGGYLMAGGANAINMFIDRDIDAHMPRTKLRPIPSGRMSPAHVLAFGITLGAAAFAVFALFVNLLSGVLAMSGLLYYVFIYTRWLKRTSPQNIVVGGAAGAFPPLVGWAAATGQISLTAVYMFLIVFFWTPPHFWALALVKQKDYGRVGIPMAPNVWGERETMKQMLLYTLILIPITLGPVTYGGLGAVYGVSAAVLGAWFLRDVVRVMRAADFVRPAWTLYRNSLLYLALLFAAMAVDGLVSRGEPSPGVVFVRSSPVAVTLPGERP